MSEWRDEVPTCDDASLIEAKGLMKTFGSTRALDGFDLRVRAGEVHGFLGPNGAGKSTTIRAILGQLHLDGGHLTVFGQHPFRDAVAIHKRLAYVPGDTALWAGLTGGQCIDMLGAFHGRQNSARRHELVERFSLDPTKRARTYSKGNRQKVALIAALSVEADLLLLDEPTSGLDPVMEKVFQDVIRERTALGATVLLSSHVLDEVEALCDRVTIIRAGKTVTTGTLDDLRHATTVTVLATLDRELSGAELNGVNDVEQSHTGDGIRIQFNVPRESVSRAVGQVLSAEPSSLVVRPPSLDEIFLSQYQDQP